MHFRTHVKAEHRGISGQDEYSDGMVEHDMHVGECSSCSTSSASPTTRSCMYSTDNGPHYNTWPDAGTTPFRSEKNSNWEGAYRVPAFVRWPGHFPAGKTLNGIVAHEDWLPTFAAVAGDAGRQGEAAEGRRPSTAATTGTTSTATTSSTTSAARRRSRRARSSGT